jgi:hypothetical protein
VSCGWWWGTDPKKFFQIFSNFPLKVESVNGLAPLYIGKYKKHYLEVVLCQEKRDRRGL